MFSSNRQVQRKHVADPDPFERKVSRFNYIIQFRQLIRLPVSANYVYNSIMGDAQLLITDTNSIPARLSPE